MNRKPSTTLAKWVLLGPAGVIGTNLQSSAAAMAPPDTLRLAGVVRDFTPTHPDFGVTSALGTGHYVRNVAPTLGADGRPVFTGGGLQVTSDWLDKDGNPIMPYAGPGLPGGHFDVDVYDAPVTTERYHEHEFDDKFDVTYVDVANDPKLLFGDIIGSGYPNDLRIEFTNAHHGGGGTYTFEAAAGVQTGPTADGFTTTFTPSALTQLRVDFVALAALRGTSPGTSQADVVDRDDSLSIRMYDVTTDALVYELAVYHHEKKKKKKGGPESTSTGNDVCGAAINDTAGTLGNAGTGAVTDAASFDQWFSDSLDTNLSARHSIALERNAEGVYEYLTDDFFPVDGRLMDDASNPHNDFFTYTFSATLTYNQCTAQFFEFEGSDDAWVFIDDKLVLDLGGTTTHSGQYVALDRLGLVDGQEYTLSFYYAHRRSTVDSLFNMRTNIELGTGSTITMVTAPFD